MSFQRLSCLHWPFLHRNTGITDPCYRSCFLWALSISGLRSTGLHGKCFTHWDISPLLRHAFCWHSSKKQIYTIVSAWKINRTKQRPRHASSITRPCAHLTPSYLPTSDTLFWKSCSVHLLTDKLELLAGTEMVDSGDPRTKNWVWLQPLPMTPNHWHFHSPAFIKYTSNVLVKIRCTNTCGVYYIVLK